MANRRIVTSIPLIASLLVIFFLSSCKKTVRFDRKPVAPATTAEPAPNTSNQEAVGTPPAPQPVPDTTLKLEVKRLNAESWWKVCLEAWVVEFPQTRQAVGCNTDATAADKVIELAGSSKQCNTVALSFQVFKNTKPCTGSATSCEHESAAMHTRSTAQSTDQDFFRAGYLPELKLPFSRKDLSPVSIASSFVQEYQGSGTPTSFRVFFEDQSNTSMNAWKAGGDARTSGIDYFDYVVEFGSTNAPLALEGNSNISCKKK
jgi:hypothetical protein